MEIIKLAIKLLRLCLFLIPALLLLLAAIEVGKWAVGRQGVLDFIEKFKEEIDE